MDSRLRVGLIAGGGAAITTFLLSITGLWICGPILAVICGLSAGMQVARDPHLRQQSLAAAVLAGTYAGLLLLLAQISGMILFAGTPPAAKIFQQLAAMDPAYTTTTIRIILFISSIFIGLIDIGVIIGAAVGMVAYLNRRQTAAPPSPVATMPPPVATTAQLAVAAPPPLPTPPAIYPPTPEFYGHPSILKIAVTLTQVDNTATARQSTPDDDTSQTTTIP